MRLNSRRHALYVLGSILCLFNLSACNGSGNTTLFGDDGLPGFTPTPAPQIAVRDLGWQPGIFYDQSYYQNFCAEPRTGADPFNNNQPYPDVLGTLLDEKLFLRSWTNDLYLWYNEVPDPDPDDHTLSDYFNLLKTTGLTPDGANKDNFHFSQDTLEYNTRTVSGQTFGYGMSFSFPPGEAIVRKVITGSPAHEAGVRRGMQIVEVNGTDVRFMVNNEQIAAISDALFTEATGEVHNFVFEALSTQEQLSVALTSAVVGSEPVKDPVVINTATGNVGYIYFDSHTNPSEIALYEAFTVIESQNVTDLVLDLRYNGGGLLAIASQASYMIAGDAMTRDEAFYSVVFNDKYAERDPFSGDVNQPIPFVDRGLDFSLSRNIELPTLDLNRVYVLTTGSTCSASETIINGLRGVGVEVIQIGGTTCGKPYGFYPQDNCGTTYFSIQFTGVNAVGFGEYSSGFSPSNESGAVGVSLPGCYAEDDITKALGDETESLLATALHHRQTGECLSLSLAKTQRNEEKFRSKGLELKPPATPGVQNAILRLK